MARELKEKPVNSELQETFKEYHEKRLEERDRIDEMQKRDRKGVNAKMQMTSSDAFIKMSWGVESFDEFEEFAFEEADGHIEQWPELKDNVYQGTTKIITMEIITDTIDHLSGGKKFRKAKKNPNDSDRPETQPPTETTQIQTAPTDQAQNNEKQQEQI